MEARLGAFCLRPARCRVSKFRCAFPNFPAYAALARARGWAVRPATWWAWAMNRSMGPLVLFEIFEKWAERMKTVSRRFELRCTNSALPGLDAGSEAQCASNT